MRRLIISAPFGNYLRFQDTTPTIGTYTLHRRAGPLLRLWRLLRTVRCNRQQQSWINKMGLPSPGIDALDNTGDCILSIHGFNTEEWLALVSKAARLMAIALEFNLSCPNVSHAPAVDEVLPAIQLAKKHGLAIIAKLPPVRWMDAVWSLYAAGVTRFHLCNTIPTPGGGISGKPLMQYSLWAVSEVRQALGTAITLIGGGGVTCPDDVKRYTDAGANHVAVGSMLFNPLNWRKIRSFVELLETD